jgi:hypothetical protein
LQTGLLAAWGRMSSPAIAVDGLLRNTLPVSLVDLRGRRQCWLVDGPVCIPSPRLFDVFLWLDILSAKASREARMGDTLFDKMHEFFYGKALQQPRSRKVQRLVVSASAPERSGSEGDITWDRLSQTTGRTERGMGPTRRHAPR